MFDKTLREILVAKKEEKGHVSVQDVDEILRLIEGALHRLKFRV
jgi:hypothetical protein